MLLWIVTLGLVALVLWQLGEAIWGHRTVHGGTRALRVAINLAEAALFGVLAWSAGSVAAKGGSSQPSKSFTEVVIGLPGGPVLIGLAGAGLVIGACYAVYRGVTSAFLRELDLSGASPRAGATGPSGSAGSAGRRSGWCTGFPACCSSSRRRRTTRRTPTTLDSGLRTVADEPYGPPLIVALALGLVAFGVYCFFDARYRKA